MNQRMNRGRQIALPTLLIAGIVALAQAASPPRNAPSTPAARAASRPAPCPRGGCGSHWKVTRSTPVYMLPDLKAHVLFVAKPGEVLEIVPTEMRLAGAIASPAAKACCRDGVYDPDQQTDVVNHVGEGYVPVFHGVAPVPAPPASAGCGQASGSSPCGEGVALREPGGLGSWVWVASADGKRHGWALAPKR